LATNLNDTVRNYAYRLLLSLEDPLPVPLLYGEPARREFSPERLAYACLMAERLVKSSTDLPKSSADSLTSDHIHFQAQALIGLLRMEAEYGPAEIRTYLQDPIIRAATNRLVQDGYWGEDMLADTLTN
jgi:hypothetical protein